MNEITVRVTKNYGSEVIYPVCDKAKLFARIAGTRTLTRAVLENVKAIGYKINVQVPEIQL